MTKKIVVAIVVIVLIGLYLSVYVVNQSQQGVVLRGGKVLAVTNPGLHMAYPFIDTVDVVDQSIQSSDFLIPAVLTSDQQALNIELLVNWKVQEAGAFDQATHNSPSMLNDAIQKALLPVVQAIVKEKTATQLLTAEQQQSLVGSVTKAAREAAVPFCVQVQGVQVVSVVLTESATTASYTAMQDHFAQMATAITAQGQQQAAKVRADADQSAALMISQAQVTAAQLHAQGDAQAALIAAKAYQQDPEFYKFYYGLEAYQHTFNSPQTILILKPKGEFFNYFNSSQP
jgi:membrane protease subunit HflC